MGKSYRDNRKWRNERPNEHKSYGEKRNRDLRKSVWDQIKDLGY